MTYKGWGIAEPADALNHAGKEVTLSGLRDAILELASGAMVCLDEGGWPRLVRPLPQPDGDVFQVLMHRGWLESMANGGSFKLSDAGRLAYLHSTDELGDGRLLHPHEWRN